MTRKERESRCGLTPGTYRYNQRHHIRLAGSKFYLNKIKVRLSERMTRTEAQIKDLEVTLEKLSA